MFDLKSEEDQATETLINLDPDTLLGSAGAYWSTDRISSVWVHSLGFRGHWFLVSKYGIGIEFIGMTSRYHPEKYDNLPIPLMMSRWGASFEYSPTIRKRFHPNYILAIGRGKAEFDQSSTDTDIENLKSKKFFWYLSPEIDTEVNLTKNVKLYGSMRYFIPFAIKGNKEISNKDLSHISLLVGLRFGYTSL
ncbi:MAG: hypothetical protein R3B45_01555 [Bdellovibrionota bacterium]